MCSDLDNRAEKYMRSVMNHDGDVFSRSDLYEYIIEAYKQGYKEANDLVCHNKRCSQRLPKEGEEEDDNFDFEKAITAKAKKVLKSLGME